MKNRRLGIILTLLCALPAWAGQAIPYSGSRTGEGAFTLTVKDTDIHTTYELVDADTGFTQMGSDTTISVAWAAKSYWDSTDAGKGTNVKAAWKLSSSADASPLNNFLRSLTSGSGSYVSAVFSNGFSPTVATPTLYRSDTDFRYSTTSWAVSLWAKSNSATNPSAAETVYSQAKSPDDFRLQFDTSGRPVLTVTDDGSATTDAITFGVDKYDGNWHQFVIGRRGSKWVLNVDGVDSTTAVSAAAASLDPDTVYIATRRNQFASRFAGKVDEIFIKADSTLLTTSLGFPFYGYQRGRENQGLSADSAKVIISGIKASDSSYVSASVKVPLGSAGVSSFNFRALESVVADSDEVAPLLVYSTAGSPRAAKLDSIPSYALDNPQELRLFGKSSNGLLKDISFSHESPTDTTLWEVRVYPSLGDLRSPTTGYYVAAFARLHRDLNAYTYTLDKTLPPYAAVAVYVKAASGSLRRVTGSAILRGERK